MSRWLDVNDAIVVSASRRLARQSALDIGLGQTRAEEVAIVTSEAVSNALRHGGGGRVLIEKTLSHRGESLALVVADNGGGIGHLDRAMTDGTSSTGSAGLGLGAIQRLSDRFDIWSEPGQGTVVSCSFYESAAPSGPAGLRFAGLTCCHPTETVCGDHWTARIRSSGIDVLLCDGLGHGPAAAQEAQDVAAAFVADDGLPGDILSRISKRMTGRRGAVATAVQIDTQKQSLSYGGVGNISAFLVRDDRIERFSERDGRIGGRPLTAQSNSKTVRQGDVIVLHSDGLATIRVNDVSMALFTRSPQIIAAVLLHRNFRGRDDASIAVVRID